jgi:APA family basic amino acid/polyamine antiporter
MASPAGTLGLWLASCALVLAGALTFGELAARRPQGGGAYVYLREAWGPRAAFLYGWQSLLIMDPGVVAALALGLSQYLVVLFPGAAGRERWLALAAVWVLAAVGMSGLRLSSRVLNGLTAGKVAALVAIVAAAAAVGSGSLSHLSPFFARRAGAPPMREALGLGLIGAFYSFGGFWEASRVAGEVRDPRRQLPRALALGTAVVTTLYVATTLAFLYLVPPEGARDPQTFARRAGEALLGPAGPTVLSVVVSLSVVASALALIVMAPRVYLAMNRDRLFPAPLAVLDARTGSPRRATALLAAIASIYVLSGSFPQVVAFFMCTALVFVGLAAAGLFVLRRRDGAAAAFRAPGYPGTTVLFLAFTLAVVFLIALARPIPALAGFGLVLAGLPLYRVVAAGTPRARRVERETP